MVNRIVLIMCLILCFRSVCFAETDRAASKVADAFLEGIRLIELSEGKKMLLDTAWFPESKYPVISEMKTIFEGMFPTDNPKIKGYKRLIEIKGVSYAKTLLTQKYLLISYKDKATNKWKVYDFREAVDIDHEADVACDISWQTDQNEKMLKMGMKPVDYSAGCSYWASLAGRLSQAMENRIRANEFESHKSQEKRTESRDYRKLKGIPQPERYLEVLKKIMSQ